MTQKVVSMDHETRKVVSTDLEILMVPGKALATQSDHQLVPAISKVELTDLVTQMAAWTDRTN